VGIQLIQPPLQSAGGSPSPAAEPLSSDAQQAYLWRFGIRFFWNST
jgi:hypothetical protein